MSVDYGISDSTKPWDPGRGTPKLQNSTPIGHLIGERLNCCDAMHIE